MLELLNYGHNLRGLFKTCFKRFEISNIEDHYYLFQTKLLKKISLILAGLAKIFFT